jgi:hypothetical protein
MFQLTNESGSELHDAQTEHPGPVIGVCSTGAASVVVTS